MAKKIDKWIWLGPLFIVIGAGLWGTETYFRVFLNTKFDSEVLVFHEHLFCILFTLPFALTAWKEWKNIPKQAWIWLILSGSVGSALGTTFFTMSLSALNPSVANVLLNFQPIVSIAFAHFLLSEKPGQRFYFWAGVALLAGLVIAANGFSFSQMQVSVGLIYITITALAWGFSTVAGRGAMLHMPLRVATLGRFVIGMLTLFFSLLLKGKFVSDQLRWEQLADSQVLINFVWLSAFAGVIPLFLYFKGLSKTPASVGGICELTQTFSALILTWGIMGNPLSLTQFVAGCVLIVAAYMVNLNYSKANR